MGMNIKRLSLLICISIFTSASYAFTIEDVNFDTLFGIQSRNYENDPISPVQRRHEFATAYFQQEISYRWNNGKDSWVLTPYLSITRFEDPWSIDHEGYVPFIVPIPIINFGDTRTAHRTYGDIREFLWTHIADSNAWELRTGIGKVFWGVTESQHLVDVINQKDFRTDLDGEDKLGQPMINLTLVKDYGNLDFFILPGFRERAYQSKVGRLTPVFVQNPYAPISQVSSLNPNPAIMISDEFVAYESGAEELHTDFAFRWSHSIGVNDIGLSFFQGTNREPILQSPVNEDGDSLAATTTALYPSVLYVTPYYEQMTQFGIDYQATLGAWLLKFEGIYRDSDSLKTPVQDDLDDDGSINGSATDFTTDYTAFTLGVEYTINGIFNTPADLGLIAEFMSDSREFEATNPNQNDVFIGLRYANNNAADPSILFGVIQDLDVESYVAVLEASRRVGESSKVIIEAMHAYADGQAPAEIDAGFDITTSIDNEDHVRLAWETYF